MTGIGMNKLESAIVERVDESNGLLTREDVQATMVAKGWKMSEVAASIDTLVSRSTLLTDQAGYLQFFFPDGSKRSVPFMNQIDLDKAVPEYTSNSLHEANVQANQELHIPESHKMAHDPVNSPTHYTRGGIETIDFIEAKGLNFLLGNVVKYVSRAGFKADAKLQDLKKAQWYLTREISRLKKDE